MFSFRRARAALRARHTVSCHPARGRLTLETLEERALPSFGAPIDTPVGTDPVAVAVGDFNGDGLLDAAVVDHGSGTAAGDLRVLLGNGDGTFVSGGAYRAGVGPVAVVVGDFDGDGNLDIVVASTVSPAGIGGQIVVLRGNGDGTFQPPVFTQLIGTPTALAGGIDYNGDGIPDLLVGEAGDGRTSGIYVLLGNGDGTFQQGAHFPLLNAGRPTAVTAIGDVDGDGVPDIAATVATPGGQGFVAVWLSSDPSQAPQFYPVGIKPSSIVAADFNGDFITDLAVANTGVNIAVGSVSILYGNGDGTFQDAVNYPAGPDPTNLALGDFNGDGVTDLAVTNPIPGTVRGGVAILYGDGQGGFSKPDFYLAGSGSTGLAVGDFNGDGLDDLIVANAYSNNVSVLLQQADSAAAGEVSSRLVARNHDAQAEAAVLPGVSLRAAEEEYFQSLAGETTGHRDAELAVLVRSLLTPRAQVFSLDLESLL